MKPSVIEKRVTTRNEFGELLSGTDTRPHNPTAASQTVLLVHGFHTDRNDYGLLSGLARHLGGEGIRSFRFDFSGCGRSEGNFEATTLTKLTGDLKAMLKFAAAGRSVSRMGVIAQSFGTSVMAALDPQVRAMVMLGAIANPQTILANFFGKGYRPTGISERLRSAGYRTRVSPVFWTDLNRYDLPNSLARSRRPILFVNGTADENVPTSEAETYFGVVGGDKSWALIGGADHDLNPHHTIAYALITDWISSRLKLSAIGNGC
jgi:pimeloyl-ACP methyl ester carboxylesterase